MAGWARLRRQPLRIMGLIIFLVIVVAGLPAAIREAVWQGLLAQKILAGMLFGFSLLAMSLVWSTGQRIDAWAFLFLNLHGSRPHWLDQIMLGFTQMGSGIVALGISLITYFAGNPVLASELLIGTVTLWMVVELVKFVAHRSRPQIRLTQARIVGLQAVGRSFPSGHTSQAFFLATLLVQQTHPHVWGGALLYSAAFFVGITRIYVGAHYPRDVLAGAIFGSAWGLMVGMITLPG